MPKLFIGNDKFSEFKPPPNPFGNIMFGKNEVRSGSLDPSVAFHEEVDRFLCDEVADVCDKLGDAFELPVELKLN